MEQAKMIFEDITLNLGVLASLMALNYAATMVNEQVGYAVPANIRGAVIGGALSFAQQSAYKMFAHTPANVIK